MLGSIIPSPFDQIGRRTFLFYPAIVGVEHNEWTLRRITSGEVQVINAKTSEELWIPRRFLGEITAIEDPFLIAGLVKELEYKDGAIVPHVRRVIEMPRAVNGGTVSGSAAMPVRSFRNAGPAAVVGIRVETGPSSKTGKRLLSWVVAGIIACIVIAEALIAFGGHRKLTKESRPGWFPSQEFPLRFRGY